MLRLVRALFLVAPLYAFESTPAEAQTHTIVGHIATEGRPVVGADIFVTVAPSLETFSDHSDSLGNFRVVVARGTGEYVLSVSALGFKLFRQRVSITSPDTLARVSVSLVPSVTSMATVRVEARHPRPAPSLATDGRAGTSGVDKTFDGAGGMLPPDLQGDLDAMASTIATLSTASGAVSAYGLGSEANSTTLNGLAFSGTDLPRDARTTTRFRTSPWDPTVGGFNGVQTAVSLLPGGNVTTRRGHVALDLPELQVIDRGAQGLGQQFTGFSLDEGGSGALALDKVFYNLGVHVAHRSAAISSLETLDPDALERAGISPDSAARAINLASGLGIPIRLNNSPTERSSTTLSFIERIDRAPPPAVGNAPSGPTLAFTGFGRYGVSDALNLTPSTGSAASGRETTSLGGVQTLYSRYFGSNGDYINETTSSLSLSNTRLVPYTQSPTATVLVESPEAIGSLMLGGNGTLSQATSSWTWDTVNQTGFLINGRESLPVKFYVESRLDGYTASPSENRLGDFSYSSLADLAANQPDVYTRSVNAHAVSSGEWQGAAAFGMDWTHGALTLTGGTRVDANAFVLKPADNPDVDQLFHVQSNLIPSSAALSPRLGFVWRYTPTIGYLTFNGLTSSFNRGQAQLRGGIGRFRGSLAPTMLETTMEERGLPSDVHELSCVGSAVPAAEWQSYSNEASIPSTCAGGASTFSDTAPDVTLVGSHLQPSDSWRGNLGWTTSQFFGNYVSIDGVYSYTSHITSSVDLNLAGAPRFTLPDENNRPVFASVASVVPSTGQIAVADTRQAADYGSVSELLSDMHATAKQVSVTVMPNIPFTAGVLVFSYAYTDAHVESRGFDATTAGDPRAVEWSPSSLTSRHAVTAQWAHYFRAIDLVVTAYGRLSSGLPFTPMVAGDINGDGSSNDRAFVFDPSRTKDAVVANGMTNLLENGSATARNCLGATLGQIAPRNECTGPWSSTLNASLMFGDFPHVDSRTRLYVYFANISSGLDQALHGSAHLLGWGVPQFPDPVLYRVRGFDPTTQRFLYDVNARFGSTDPATNLRRAPFRVTFELEFGLGATGDMQRVEQTIRERPSLVGTRASADSIKARYLRTAGTDIYAMILRMSDSLALSRSQVDRLRERQLVLRHRADSIYTDLAAYLANLPANPDLSVAARRVSQTRDSLWTVIRAERSFILTALNSAQIRLLSPPLRQMILDVDDRTLFFGGGWT